MSITFEQGWAARPFKVQFPQLSDDSAAQLDAINSAITTLWVEDLLTDSTYSLLRNRKFPQIVSRKLAELDKQA